MRKLLTARFPAPPARSAAARRSRVARRLSGRRCRPPLVATALHPGRRSRAPVLSRRRVPRIARRSRRLALPPRARRAHRRATSGGPRRSSSRSSTGIPTRSSRPTRSTIAAYALYKIGNSSDLESAILALDRQATRYPKAGTLSDAKQLRASIMSEQAKRGDPASALKIFEERAESLSSENRCPTDDDECAHHRARGHHAAGPRSGAARAPEGARAQGRVLHPSSQARGHTCVAQTKEEERADILLRVASTDPSTEVRREAVQWLSQVNTERAAQGARLDPLQRSRRGHARQGALCALAAPQSVARASRCASSPKQTNVSTELRVRAVYYHRHSARTGDESDYFTCAVRQDGEPGDSRSDHPGRRQTSATPIASRGCSASHATRTRRSSCARRRSTTRDRHPALRNVFVGARLRARVEGPAAAVRRVQRPAGDAGADAVRLRAAS